MVSVKLLLFMALLITLSASGSGNLLNYIVPTIMSKYYTLGPTKEGYRFKSEDSNGNLREEMSVILNPGTDKEEMVVMGTYSIIDERTNTETKTTFTADKNGYNARYKIRKLSARALKSAANG